MLVPAPLPCPLPACSSCHANKRRLVSVWGSFQNPIGMQSKHRLQHVHGSFGNLPFGTRSAFLQISLEKVELKRFVRDSFSFRSKKLSREGSFGMRLARSPFEFFVAFAELRIHFSRSFTEGCEKLNKVQLPKCPSST